MTTTKTLAALLALGLAALTSLSAHAQATGPAATPRIDQRQANQERRIDQGVASGELTRREARRMERQQARVDRAEDLAKADGKVTRAERRQLTTMQNKTSRHIYRQKHDAQRRGPAATSN